MRLAPLGLFLLFSMPGFGGCGLFLGVNSSAVNDPLAQGSFMTVRVFNCSGRSVQVMAYRTLRKT